MTIIENYIAPSNWLFYEFKNPFISQFIAWMWLLSYFGSTFGKIFNNEELNFKELILYYIILIVCICGITITNVTFVTEESIVNYSPLSLNGKTYNYNKFKHTVYV